MEQFSFTEALKRFSNFANISNITDIPIHVIESILIQFTKMIEGKMPRGEKVQEDKRNKGYRIIYKSPDGLGKKTQWLSYEDIIDRYNKIY